jgi:Tfp pilus assembly protein PilX
MKLNTRKNQNGSILLAFVIMLPFLILITALYMQLSVDSVNIARRDTLHTHAQLAADAGVDVTTRQISVSETYGGSGTETELQANTNGIRTTYQTTVSNPSADQKVITSIGKAYRGNSTSPTSTITIVVNLRPVSSGEYSVVSGVGGLIMSNSARILGGDVLINGKISLSNSAQIGLSTSPVNLEVAHQTCPSGSSPGASYPRYCNSGEDGQPITLNNTSQIFGTVKANNQTNGTRMSSPGLQTPHCLVSGANPSGTNCVMAQGLPPHNRDALKTTINNADAANTPDAQTGAAAGCSSGTKTWPANLKINGNVSISNTCRLTVNGDVWITGTLSVSNSAEMIVSNSAGTTRPVLMVDGATATFSNSSILRSNSSSTGFMVINYRSTASCSPDCADVTGNDLYNSRSVDRVILSNSASGPNTIFYSRWGKVNVSNSGQIGALVGQTVEISNSGAITFGTSTGTATRFWVIDSYNRQF